MDGGDAFVWTGLLLFSRDGRTGRAMRDRGVGGVRRLDDDGVKEIAKWHDRRISKRCLALCRMEKNQAKETKRAKRKVERDQKMRWPRPSLGLFGRQFGPDYMGYMTHGSRSDLPLWSSP